MIESEPKICDTCKTKPYLVTSFLGYHCECGPCGLIVPPFGASTREEAIEVWNREHGLKEEPHNVQ